MTSCEQGKELSAGVPNAIRIRALVKEYPGGDGVHGLDLDVPQGCSFGLLGPNGAGKSTTIKILMGLLAPTSGDANVLGRSVLAESEEIRRRVGYVPEQHHMYPWMSVAEVIWFTRSFFPSWDTSLCDELLKHYGLDPSKKVKALSHGMKTKLALILALSHVPELLLLDEPTTGLDPIIREEFLDGLKHLLQRQSCTVLLSSHIMSDIEKVADTIGIINEGRLLICARREDLITRTKRLRIKIESGQRSPAAPEGTIFEDIVDGRRHLTVRDFSADTLQRVRQQTGTEDIEVFDLSLEEIFKDFIKGARAIC
jgi:ABC-2 type transport system ATP-binding protein